MSSLTREVRKASPLRAYFSRHAQVVVASLGRMARAPFATLTTVLVIAITLALPTALHLAIKNIQSLSGSWESAVDFSVYFAPGIDEAEARNVGKLIASRADIETLRFVSADEAREEFARDPVFSATLESLEENPLPHALVIRPRNALSAPAVQLLREDLSGLPEIELVQFDTDWVQRFNAILALVERAVQIIGALLGIAILIVIGNTIRLDIQSRQQEIVVTKLIGASNGFIRRPFLYTGFLYGLAGGLIALALITVTLTLIASPVQTLAGLYASGFSLDGLTLKETGLLVAAGAALGWIGSFIATMRHLRRIEPR